MQECGDVFLGLFLLYFYSIWFLLFVPWLLLLQHLLRTEFQADRLHRRNTWTMGGAETHGNNDFKEMENELFEIEEVIDLEEEEVISRKEEGDSEPKRVRIKWTKIVNWKTKWKSLRILGSISVFCSRERERDAFRLIWT